MSSRDAFFKYAQDREYIRVARESGAEKPWSTDPIFLNYRFCNIFREDDRTTKWFADNVRDPLASNPAVAMATVIFRWFNKIETGKVLLEWDLFTDWDPTLADMQLMDLKPLVTGAYIIKTPNGMNKLQGLIDVIGRSRPYVDQMVEACIGIANASLEEAHTMLCRAPFLGPFMAYEIITDLRHTDLLSHASDIMTWANPGPGAARGAGRVWHNDPDRYSRSSKKDVVVIMEIMQRLLKQSQDPFNWPWTTRPWEMRDVEHTLCEFDKYERMRLGQGRPKQRYQGAADE